MKPARARAQKAKGLGRSGVVGIDVRGDAVHLVHLVGVFARPSRIDFRCEPIDPALYPVDPIEATSAAIARAANGLDLSAIPVAIVAPNNREALRVKRFPAMKASTLAAAAKLALESSSALDEPARRTRFYVQRSGVADDGSKFVDVVLLEMSEPAIEDAQKLATAAGLRLARVSSPALALGMALARAGGEKGTSLVVDLSGPVTTLNTFAGGDFLLAREADVGMDLLSGDLAELLAGDSLMSSEPATAAGSVLDAIGIEGAASAALLAIEEAPPPAPGRVSPEKLRVEIVRSNRYLASHYRKPIERIYLAGAPREARALASHLASGIDVPVELLDPSAALAGPALRGEPTCASARALGAALELLTPRAKRRYQMLAEKPSLRARVFHPAIAIAAAIVIALCGVYGALLTRTARAEATRTQLANELAAATEALVVPSTRLDPAQVEARLSSYRSLRDASPRWSRPLRALAEALPEGAWLTEIAIAEGDADDLPGIEEILSGVGDAGAVEAVEEPASDATRIVVTGRALDVGAVSSFLANLEASGVLADPRVVSIETPEKNRPSEAGAAETPGVAGAREPYEFVIDAKPELFAAPSEDLGEDPQ